MGCIRTAMPNEKKYPPALEAHLKQWQEIAERVRRQMEPFRAIHESIRKSIQPIVETREVLQKTLEPILANQERWRQIAEAVRLPQIVLPDLSPIAKQVIDFQKAIQASISSAFLELQKAFRELPARTQEAVLLLGQHGWYLDSEMSLPALWELKHALAEGNILEAEAALLEYFEGRLIEIEESITTKFPHRGLLIHSAFNAHRREEYALSIPVLLAQADGICKETVDQHVFLKQDKKPRTAIYVAQIAADTYMAALLSPLSETLPIGASEKERPEGFTALNRHTVLHGESLDYGSKVNSLKAISLVNYVAHVLPASNP
jgi:hypothetical protein